MYVQTTLVQQPAWPRTIARWMATFVGFPLGGVAAEMIVGRIDGLAPALVGGAITGGVLGLAQWWGIRRSGIATANWIAASAVGLAGGLAMGAAAVDYRTDLGSLAAQGAICGVALGIAQALVLRPRLGRWAWTWPAALGALWALGWTTTTGIGVDVETQYSVFGSSGALVVTAGSSVLALALARHATGD